MTTTEATFPSRTRYHSLVGAGDDLTELLQRGEVGVRVGEAVDGAHERDVVVHERAGPLVVLARPRVEELLRHVRCAGHAASCGWLSYRHETTVAGTQPGMAGRPRSLSQSPRRRRPGHRPGAGAGIVASGYADAKANAPWIC